MLDILNILSLFYYDRLSFGIRKAFKSVDLSAHSSDPSIFPPQRSTHLFALSLQVETVRRMRADIIISLDAIVYFNDYKVYASCYQIYQANMRSILSFTRSRKGSGSFMSVQAQLGLLPPTKLERC